MRSGRFCDPAASRHRPPQVFDADGLSPRARSEGGRRTPQQDLNGLRVVRADHCQDQIKLAAAFELCDRPRGLRPDSLRAGRSARRTFGSTRRTAVADRSRAHNSTNPAVAAKDCYGRQWSDIVASSAQKLCNLRLRSMHASHSAARRGGAQGGHPQRAARRFPCPADRLQAYVAGTMNTIDWSSVRLVRRRGSDGISRRTASAPTPEAPAQADRRSLGAQVRAGCRRASSEEAQAQKVRPPALASADFRRPPADPNPFAYTDPSTLIVTGEDASLRQKRARRFQLDQQQHLSKTAWSPAAHTPEPDAVYDAVRQRWPAVD